MTTCIFQSTAELGFFDSSQSEDDVTDLPSNDPVDETMNNCIDNCPDDGMYVLVTEAVLALRASFEFFFKVLSIFNILHSVANQFCIH